MSKLPSKGEFWQAFAATTILPINGSQKAVLGCLLDHANPKSGSCYPSEALIAAETGCPTRTVERAIAELLRTPYVSRQRRAQSSNCYNINFDALFKAWADYKSRGAAYRESRNKQTPKVADQYVKSGGRLPSTVAGKQKHGTGKKENKSRMASPQSGDALTAPLSPPAGEVKNLGGLLARLERAFRTDPSKIENLNGWEDWLLDNWLDGDKDDPNVQWAARLGEDIHHYLTETT